MIISDSGALKAFCESIIASSTTFICIDTEFDSGGKYYYPAPCLVQIGYPGGECIIDVLVPGLDYSPLKSILLLPSIVKVFHGCRADLICLRRLIGTHTEPIFDTQIAEMMCKHYDYYLSYSFLVWKFLGLTISKEGRRINWQTRPLTKSSEDYALGDVRYLSRLYPIVEDRLTKSGKKSWFEEDMQTIVEEAHENQLFYKNAYNIRPFMVWRESLAQQHNIRAETIIKEETIKSIMRSISDPDKLEAIIARCLVRGNLYYSKQQLESIIAKVAQSEDSQYCNEPDSDKVDLFCLFVGIKSKELQLSKTLVASKVVIREFLRHPNADNSLTKGWRKEHFGHLMLEVMQGTLKMSVQIQFPANWSYSLDR